MPAQRDERDFHISQRNRTPPWVWLLALLLHVPLAILLLNARRHLPRPDASVLLTVPRDSAPEVTMRFPRRSPTSSVSHQSTRPSPALEPAQSPPVNQAPALASVQPAAPGADTGGRVVAGAAALRPRYGDGRLWLQPMDHSPREIAGALTGKTPAQLDDSIVTSMVQAYLDEMAREQRENPSALPSWTTKIGGKTVGLDQKWLYLGPIKIPTALLALLPIKMQTNITQWEFNNRLQQMRSDLMEAARRAETYDDFKRAVSDLRTQKQRERDFQKNQRTPPDSSHHS